MLANCDASGLTNQTPECRLNLRTGGISASMEHSRPAVRAFPGQRQVSTFTVKGHPEADQVGNTRRPL